MGRRTGMVLQYNRYIIIFEISYTAVFFYTLKHSSDVVL